MPHPGLLACVATGEAPECLEALFILKTVENTFTFYVVKVLCGKSKRKVLYDFSEIFLQLDFAYPPL